MTRAGRTSARRRSTSSPMPTRADTTDKDPILKRAVRTKTGRTEVATQTLPSRDAFANSSCCSLMKLWTPTLPMTRMEVAPERMLVGVQIPDTRKICARSVTKDPQDFYSDDEGGRDVCHCFDGEVISFNYSLGQLGIVNCCKIQPTSKRDLNEKGNHIRRSFESSMNFSSEAPRGQSADESLEGGEAKQKPG